VLSKKTFGSETLKITTNFQKNFIGAIFIPTTPLK